MNYFITMRCYGTWLHGDARGSVDRFHNRYGEALIEPNPRLFKFRRRLMKSEPMLFNAARCFCVTEAIEGVAKHRDWTLLALKVLSNHVHVVVSTPDRVKPEKVMNDFKSWATRRLREQNLVGANAEVWEEHGSTQYLYTQQSIDAACHYVLHCQEEEPRA
jgi:REP element-mobilizing transposase RayT